MHDGLLEEATRYYPYRHLNTLNTVGYKEIFEYMNGLYYLDTSINLIKQDSRRYAKRQLTWFRGKSTLPEENFSEVTPAISDRIARRLGLS